MCAAGVAQSPFPHESPRTPNCARNSTLQDAITDGRSELNHVFKTLPNLLVTFSHFDNIDHLSHSN